MILDSTHSEYSCRNDDRYRVWKAPIVPARPKPQNTVQKAPTTHSHAYFVNISAQTGGVGDSLSIHHLEKLLHPLHKSLLPSHHLYRPNTETLAFLLLAHVERFWTVLARFPVSPQLTRLVRLDSFDAGVMLRVVWRKGP